MSDQKLFVSQNAHIFVALQVNGAKKKLPCTCRYVPFAIAVCHRLRRKQILNIWRFLSFLWFPTHLFRSGLTRSKARLEGVETGRRVPWVQQATLDKAYTGAVNYIHLGTCPVPAAKTVRFSLRQSQSSVVLSKEGGLSGCLIFFRSCLIATTDCYWFAFVFDFFEFSK